MIRDIWQSYRRLPLWVQLWVALILVPVNAASLLFVAHPWGALVAGLAVGGMALNLPIMLMDRGFSRAMALPHLLLWIPLVALLIWLLASSSVAPPAQAGFLWLLLAIDLLSLGFDIPDALKWLRGERNPA